MTQASSLTLSFSPHLLTSAGLCSLHSTRHLRLTSIKFPTPRQPPSPSHIDRVICHVLSMVIDTSSRAANDDVLSPAHGPPQNSPITHRKAMPSSLSSSVL